MPQHKSIFEVRYHTLQSTILNCLVLVALYTYSVVVGDSHTSVELSPSPLGGYLSQWGESHTLLSYVVLCVGVLYVSISVAQLASRLRLYGVSSHLPMAMYPMLMLMVGSRGDIVVGVVETLLLLNVMKNLFSSYRASNSSGTLSLGALSLGAMPLFYPPAIVLWVVIPPMFIIFERTLREVIVTLSSLVVPLFSYLYIRWMLGGEFMEELSQFWDSVVVQSGEYLWNSATIVEAVAYLLTGAILLMSTIFMHQLDNTIKARRRLVMSSLLAFACIVMVVIPSSGVLSLWLLALPLALLAPVVMLRMRRVMSFWIYLLLFIVGVLSAFLRYFLNFV